MQKLVIHGRLPGRNEAEKAARSHWSKGAKMKREYTDLIYFECLSQHIMPFENKVNITVTFYEKDRRRDDDNVISSLKWILDGIVKARVIKDDSPKYVKLYINEIKYDKDFPRIEVEINESEVDE